MNPIIIEINNNDSIQFNLGNIVLGDRLPEYTGAYTVTPKVFEQSLETKNKSLYEDVTVYEIPLSQVQNPQGGITATIG